MITKLLLVLSLLLTGCQTTRPVVKPLPDPLPLRGKPANYARQSLAATTPKEAAPPNNPPAVESEKLNQQAQLIEALVAQNDALTARFKALEHHADAPESTAPSTVDVIVVPPPVSFPPTPAPVPSAPTVASISTLLPAAPDVPTLVPNADGVIDIAALDPASPGDPPNPFAVRALPTAAARELILRVQGIVTGEKPCAVVNERVVECGHTIETLRLTQLSSDAIVLSGDRFTLSLPLGATKVRFF